MNKGWECPKCGSVYGPFVQECGYCNNNPDTRFIRDEMIRKIGISSLRNRCRVCGTIGLHGCTGGHKMKRFYGY